MFDEDLDDDEKARLANEQMERARRVTQGMMSPDFGPGESGDYFEPIPVPGASTPYKNYVERAVEASSGSVDVGMGMEAPEVPENEQVAEQTRVESIPEDVNVVLGQAADPEAQPAPDPDAPARLPDQVQQIIQPPPRDQQQDQLVGAWQPRPIPLMGAFGVRRDPRERAVRDAAARLRFDRQMYSGVGVETVGPGYVPAGPTRAQNRGSFQSQMDAANRAMGAFGHGAPMGHGGAFGHGSPMFPVGYGGAGGATPMFGMQHGWQGGFVNEGMGRQGGGGDPGGAVDQLFRFFENVTQAIERQWFTLNDLSDRLDVEDGGDHEF